MAEDVSKPSADDGNKAPAARPAAAPTRSDLRREVDQLFENFLSGGWRFPFGRSSALDPGWPRPEGWQVAPAMDMAEKQDCYEITAELPGLDENNVEIRLSNGNLTIRGEKNEEREEGDKEYHISERRYGAFQRMFRVPEGVDADRIDARVKNGVLTVTLPKSPAAQQSGKQISIKAG